MTGRPPAGDTRAAGPTTLDLETTLNDDPQTDRLDDLRAEYANTGMVMSDGAVWLFSQIVVLREQVQRLTAVLLEAATIAERLPIDDRYRHHSQLGDAWDAGRDAVVRLLRRLAAEGQPETRAVFSPDEGAHGRDPFYESDRGGENAEDCPAYHGTNPPYPFICPGPPTETVHACPPDGSGLTPCCGRTPFELPLSDRISSEAPATCPGTAVVQADGEAAS